MVIWKYQVPRDKFNTTVSFDMPTGATVLSVVNQGEYLTVYALVDPDRAKVKRAFRCELTGTPTGPLVNARFLGTVLFYGGSFVAHVWELDATH